MVKFKFQRLKIIEQIAIVFFFAVVIPMSISGFIINNINQQSVRHQLRESAILIASMVSDEMDFLIQSNQMTLNQIADTLEFLPTKSQKQKYILNVAKKYPHCDNISIVHSQKELEKITDNARLKEQPILSTQMRDGSFLVVTYSSKDANVKIFESLAEDNRQIYITDFNRHLIASHNFTPDVFQETINMLPQDSEMIEGNPIIFGD